MYNREDAELVDIIEIDGELPKCITFKELVKALDNRGLNTKTCDIGEISQEYTEEGLVVWFKQVHFSVPSTVSLPYMKLVYKTKP